MRRFFLVDYENVSDGGLAGFFDLTENDTVALFYTQNANKISIDFFQSALVRQQAAAIAFIKVLPGNQALDLQLASYLGALMASAEGDCAFYIVSKDKGYQCLMPFWKGQRGEIPLYQVRSVAEALTVTDNAPVKPKKAAKPVPAPAPVPAPQAEEATAEPVPAQETPESPVPVKSVPKKAVKAHSVSAASANKVAMNTKVQQVLSKAKYESPVIAYMASLVTKNVGDSKIKQTVYRSTIAQFGQKKGLEIYNLVKPLLK